MNVLTQFALYYKQPTESILQFWIKIIIMFMCIRYILNHMFFKTNPVSPRYKLSMTIKNQKYYLDASINGIQKVCKPSDKDQTFIIQSHPNNRKIFYIIPEKSKAYLAIHDKQLVWLPLPENNLPLDTGLFRFYTKNNKDVEIVHEKTQLAFIVSFDKDEPEPQERYLLDLTTNLNLESDTTSGLWNLEILK
jgi:hypothetical protein